MFHEPGVTHCEHCCTPVEYYKPLKSYPSDDSCRLYSDMFNIAWNLDEGGCMVNPIKFFENAMELEPVYPQVEDFYASVSECYEILLDTGVIDEYYQG